MIQTLKPFDRRYNGLIAPEQALAKLRDYRTPAEINAQKRKAAQEKQNTDGPPRVVPMPAAPDYASGLHRLMQKCAAEDLCPHPTYTASGRKGRFRPLTVSENMRSRIEDWETLTDKNGTPRSEKERSQLLHTYLDACTGICFKARSTKFKIIPICGELITIPKDFSGSFVACDYDSLEGIELDSTQAKYNELLTRTEIEEHPAWRAVLADADDGPSLLKNYRDIVFCLGQAKPDALMDFWVRDHTRTTELSSLTLYDEGYNYFAVGKNLDEKSLLLCRTFY